MAEGDRETSAPPGQQEDDKKWQYPIVRMADLPDDSQPEFIEMVTTVVERHVADLQVSSSIVEGKDEACMKPLVLAACKGVKEHLDKQYGQHWNVIIGEGFGFDVTFLKKHMLYLYFMGNLGILVWKNS